MRRIGERRPVSDDAAMIAAVLGNVRRIGVGTDVAIEIALDLQFLGRKIDALEARLGTQSTIAVDDLGGLAGQPDPRLAAMAGSDKRIVGHYAASLRSTY